MCVFMFVCLHVVCMSVYACVHTCVDTFIYVICVQSCMHAMYALCSTHAMMQCMHAGGAIQFSFFMQSRDLRPCHSSGHCCATRVGHCVA